MSQSKSALEEMFGSRIELGICAVGKNLNVLTVRGFTDLNKLSLISSAKVYDQFSENKGVQRELSKKHSEQAVRYAMQSISDDPEENPKAFPELILNVRDLSIIEFYDLNNPENTFDVADLSFDKLNGSAAVGVRIKAGDIDVNAEEPQISRVDGNHRLSATDLLRNSENPPENYPSVPFSFFLGLSALQEARIFLDINYKQQKMPPAMAAALEIMLTGDDKWKDSEKRALMIADVLRQEEHPFYGLVSDGGSTRGFREKFGKEPMMKINSLQSAVKIILDKSNTLKPTFADKPVVQLALIKSYYEAVKNVFPEAWEDKKSYILQQSIGLNGFAAFGAYLCDIAVANGGHTAEFFRPYLLAVRANLDLAKNNSLWNGVAGGRGATVVTGKLIEAASPENVANAMILDGVISPPPGIADLGSDDADSADDSVSKDEQQ